MRFSERTAHPETPNALSQAVARARSSAGDTLLDLTVSNPTIAGFAYDERTILGAIASSASMTYLPEPFGLGRARKAVAKDYGALGITVDPENIALTASSSEAYAALFKVLCDPGDEVLVPSPSYPLLSFLAAFESIRLKPYPLVYAGRWHVDLAALRASIGPRTRAIVSVAPNNPTGSYLGREELDAMLDLGLPIVSDEVFARYPLGSGVPHDRVSSVLEAERGLVFSLSGLSKLAALPQLKLGWIAVGGEEANRHDALARLELVLDTYLSVGTPVQCALPTLLEATEATRQEISTRTKRNLATVREAARAIPTANVLDVEGGWYAIVRVPETRTDEQWAIDLVDAMRVHVQPGYFFDMTRGAHLVISLLTQESVVEEGMTRIVRYVAENA